MKKHPLAAGTRVLWDGSEYVVWERAAKPGYRWIVREGMAAPILAKITNLTAVGHATTPTVRDVPVAPARATDPATSHRAAQAIQVRAGSQRHLLLTAYRGDAELTDAQAAAAVGLLGTRSCWWKRCSELRDGGFIEVTGTTRDPSTQAEVQTCRITHAGRAAL